MTEEKFRRMQIRIGTLGILSSFSGVIIGVLLGVYQFNHQQLANKNTEYKKTEWQNELTAYLHISASTGKVLTALTPGAKDVELFKDGQKEFLMLYWGEANFYADSTTREKLIDFREQLGNFKVINQLEDADNEKQLEKIRASGVQLVKAYKTAYDRTSKKLTD